MKVLDLQTKQEHLSTSDLKSKAPGRAQIAN